MKIGLILDHFSPAKGGAETYLARLTRELTTAGHHLRIYCLDGAPPDGVQLCPVQVTARSRGRLEEEFARRAVERARSDGCDVVHGVRHLLEADLYQPHGGTWAANAEARAQLAPAGLGRKLKLLSRRLSGKHRYFERADGEIFERNPQLITVAVSEWVRADIQARYGRFEPRVEVVWPAVDSEFLNPGLRDGPGLEFRKRTGIRENAPVGLFVAHDFDLKGLRHALTAFPLSRPGRKEGHLLIAGRGDIPRYQELAQELGLRGRSWFVKDRCEMTELYGAADFLVHPTHYDPCSLACLEALAAGVPVVTSASNGAAALLAEGGGRVVEKPGDVEGLAAAIEDVVERREELSVLARAAAERLAWGPHVQRMAELLTEAAAGRGRK